jgi:DNA-binding NtrC family response regulator
MSAGRLMIVDDETTFLDATADLLRREKFEVRTAPSAALALQQLAEAPADLLIADINMPGNANLELITHLRATDPRLPLILMTAHPSTQTAIDALHLTVARYLVKPIEFPDLVSHIRYLLDRSRLQRFLTESRSALASHLSGETVAPAARKLAAEITALEEVLTLPQGARVAHDPQVVLLRRALRHTIATLERTRRSFKSTELQQLRHEIEAVLRHTPTEPEPPAGKSPR